MAALSGDAPRISTWSALSKVSRAVCAVIELTSMDLPEDQNSLVNVCTLQTTLSIP